jgi:hypothetical protein
LITTLAPEAARPLAMAWPMPAVEPVTSAVFPDRSMFMRCLRGMVMEISEAADDAAIDLTHA